MDRTRMEMMTLACSIHERKEMDAEIYFLNEYFHPDHWKCRDELDELWETLHPEVKETILYMVNKEKDNETMD